ncbi:MAG: GTP-binding protein [Reyranellaceae bacterium]
MTGERLPVTVIGGYLGAGKTTLVNHLLRHAGRRRLAVLVNDFGALPIDRDLIVAAGGDTLEIAGGCVCCSYGSEMMDALIELPARRPGLDAVLLETSGVALPGPVASAVGLLPRYRLDGTVVLVDAETVRMRADDTYLGDTIARQIAAADLLLVNRCDLVDDAARADIAAWLASMAPAARQVAAVRSAVPPEVVLGIGPRGSGGAPVLSTPGGVDAASLYESVELAVDGVVEAEALARALAGLGGLLRAKGFVRDPGRGWVCLQMVGARAEIEPAATQTAGRLVAIGRRGALGRAAVEQAVAAARR